MTDTHSDTDLANAVRTAAEALNRATRLAYRAGLTVTIEVKERTTMSTGSTNMVTTRVMRDM